MNQFMEFSLSLFLKRDTMRERESAHAEVGEY